MSSCDDNNPLANNSAFQGFPAGRPLRVEVDTEAFRHNVQRVAELSSNASLMLVLKANAYGHGLVEMARHAGKHDLAVAIPEEMRVLRESAISNRVWVLEGPFGQSCIKGVENVVWVVHSLWQLELFSDLPVDDCHQICLKLDTGMNRLGMNPNDFRTALQQIKTNKSLVLKACMTHFSASDLPEGEEVDRQLSMFDSSIKSLSNIDILESAANSGGILFYPQSHRNIVRPGIILYGGMPSPSFYERDFGFRPVMKLVSSIIAIRSVPKGQGIGYGSQWVAGRNSKIATIACGYGDGYPRHAPNGTPVGVFDESSQTYERAPLVGRVSMDMITIDITDIAACGLGSKVELWGNAIKADEVALLSGTIAYELFCGITARVPRLIMHNL